MVNLKPDPKPCRQLLKTADTPTAWSQSAISHEEMIIEKDFSCTMLINQGGTKQKNKNVRNKPSY